jgi:hypothetical protein
MNPIVANPGGRLNLDDIVGREKEIQRYWKVLEGRSLVLSAERRLGKTHLGRVLSSSTRTWSRSMG